MEVCFMKVWNMHTWSWWGWRGYFLLSSSFSFQKFPIHSSLIQKPSSHFMHPPLIHFSLPLKCNVCKGKKNWLSVKTWNFTSFPFSSPLSPLFFLSNFYISRVAISIFHLFLLLTRHLKERRKRGGKVGKEERRMRGKRSWKDLPLHHHVCVCVRERL